MKYIEDNKLTDTNSNIISKIRTPYNNNTRRISIFLIYLMLIVIFIMTGINEKKAYAATSFKIYDYNTKKTTSYNGVIPVVTINGTKVADNKTCGILVNGVALLPYDIYFEASPIAADCIYDESKGIITISKYGSKITMTIGSKKATVNGKSKTLSVAPMKVKYVNSGLTKVLVPSRIVAETLGLDYNWNSSKQTISIKTKNLTLSYNDEEKFEYTGLQTKVSIDGKSLDLGKMPGIIVNNIAMLQAKKVFAESSIGAKYTYNKDEKKITIIKGNKKLVMTIGSKTAYLNDKKISLENAPLLVKNHETGVSYVMVPGRSTAINLGYEYAWDKTMAISKISTKKETSSTNTDNVLIGDTSNSGGTANSGNSGESSDTSNSNGSKTSNDAGNISGGNSDNNDTGNNPGNNSNNSSESNQAPELGDDRVYAEPGTVLNDWKADTLLYGISSGVHELIGNMNYNGIVGQISYAPDYITKNRNSDTFVFASNLPVGDVTSSNSQGVIRINVKNFSCIDQIFQLNSTESKLVNYITMYNNTANNEAIIEMNVNLSDYQYELNLSNDRMILYVTVYKNTVTKASIGVNEEGDYITISSMAPLHAELTDYIGQIDIKLPNTINGLEDFSSEITGARYIRSVVTAADDDSAHIILLADPGYELYVIENGNDYTLCLRPQDLKSSQNESNGSNGSIIETEDLITDKSGYEIIIPKPQNINKSMITEEDYYFDNYFVIRLKGDYTNYYNNNDIKYSSNVIKKITVSLNSSGDTEIKIATSKLQGYKIVMDSEAICVHIGEPKEIYKNIVVLDPGHGGPAKGAQYFGSYEKDINLQILYTVGKKYFCSDSSTLKVYYTRISDVDMALSDRAAFANKVGADLFVSLHMNAAELVPSARGTEVFYSVKNNSTNSSGLSSKKLAEMLYENLIDSLGTNTRGVKTENHTVTYRNTVPAVLIELGFMSNKEDYALLTNKEFQDKAAKTIYKTLLEVFKKYPTGR